MLSLTAHIITYFRYLPQLQISTRYSPLSPYFLHLLSTLLSSSLHLLSTFLLFRALALLIKIRPLALYRYHATEYRSIHIYFLLTTRTSRQHSPMFGQFHFIESLRTGPFCNGVRNIIHKRQSRSYCIRKITIRIIQSKTIDGVNNHL